MNKNNRKNRKNRRGIFSKYQALGNDYIILDPRRFVLPLSRNVVARLCDRHFGIGSDGILYGPSYSGGIPHLTIYNPDGSEAEKSGNGVRIFAKYLFDSKYVKTDSFDISTKGGLVAVTRNNPDATDITAVLGKLILRGQETLRIGSEKYVADLASIGNPHCVIVLDNISDDLARKLGPVIENDKLFPNRTNVQFVKVIDRGNIQVEIWERGAGYTSASGTSSAAAAGVCFERGYCDRNIIVHMPGGNLDVAIGDNFEISQRGEAHQIIKEGVLSEEFMERLKRKE